MLILKQYFYVSSSLLAFLSPAYAMLKTNIPDDKDSQSKVTAPSLAPSHSSKNSEKAIDAEPFLSHPLPVGPQNNSAVVSNTTFFEDSSPQEGESPPEPKTKKTLGSRADIAETAEKRSSTQNQIKIQDTSNQDLGKLTRDDCEQLKGICALFRKFREDPKGMPLKSRSGWINQEQLDDLKILCYIEQKNWKGGKDLNIQLEKAAVSFLHLIENVLLYGSIAPIRAMSETSQWQLLSRLLSPQPVLGSSALPLAPEIVPYIPIIRKITRNIICYFKNTEDVKTNQEHGVISINKDKILGYIPGYFPIPLGISPNYEVVRVPYAVFPENKQGVCISKDGQLIVDTGLVIDNKNLGLLPFMESSFIYCGINEEFPFTISPFEMRQFTLLQPEPTEESILKGVLGDDFPKPGTTFFMPLPRTESERNLVELLFLEDLLEKRKKGDNEALRMIAELEEETGQSIETAIEELTAEQLKIIEEQEKISQDVSQGLIKGRPEKAPKKKGPKKNAGKEVKSNLTNNQLPDKPRKLAKEKLQDIKTSGRIKYKNLLGIINKVMKNYQGPAVVEGSSGGSHKTLHSQEGAVTFVKIHGKKDLTMPAQRAKRLTEKLLKVIGLN